MVAQKFTVDLSKPLVFQVGHLGEAYQEWVHQPIVSKEGPRFFANDFLEFLTCTAWWAIPAIWLPVVCWFVTMSMRMGHTIPEVAMMVGTGVFVWTLIEYTIHRFLFHMKTQTYWANTAHYLLHGCHHKHPMDGLRLVFPPTAAAILCVPPSKNPARNLKLYHMSHHFRVQNKGFGITSKLWDIVFGTLPP
uniref:Dihydroceramide fatty acyl 2-hydroxylase FAH1 isoform X2 n=1 Tax=Elaeis guineensis var. tenera TaxID=51953 RepID=A0A8N4I991_ELAGV|nr:dihydroceramide fatty acyl 2-hydroxylase FAH1 isoform X2 [Elaeis guineensis]